MYTSHTDLFILPFNYLLICLHGIHSTVTLILIKRHYKNVILFLFVFLIALPHIDYALIFFSIYFIIIPMLIIIDEGTRTNTLLIHSLIYHHNFHMKSKYFNISKFYFNYCTLNIFHLQLEKKRIK